MFSRRVAPVLLTMLCLSLASAPASAQRRARRGASPPATRIGLVTGDPAMLLPADTFLYLDIVDAMSAINPGASVDQLYEGFAAGLAGGGAAMPVGLPEARALLESRIVIANGLPGRRPVAETPLVIVRSRSTAAAALIREKLLPLVLPAGTWAAAKAGGREFRYVGRPGSARPQPDAFAYAAFENVVMIGTAETVSSILGPAPAGFRPLASDPEYLDARRRFAPGAELFGLVHLGEVMRDVLARDGGPSSTGQAERAAGLDALRALAFASSGAATAPRTEVLLEIDRSTESLVTTALDPAPISARSSALMPATTGLAFAISVEPARMFDFLKSKVTPEAARLLGLPPASELARKIEGSSGMRARDELLAALGPEIGFALDFAPAKPAPATNEEGGGSVDAQAPPEPAPAANFGMPSVLTFIEVKNPEAARRGLARYVNRNSEEQLAESEHAGVTITQAGNSAVAVMDGFAVIGAPEDVRRAIDAKRSGATVAAITGFPGMLSRIPAETVAALFITPALVEQIGSSIRSSTPQAVGLVDYSAFKPSVTAVVKDALGLYSSADSPALVAPYVIGAGAALVLPALLAASSLMGPRAARDGVRTTCSRGALMEAAHRGTRPGRGYPSRPGELDAHAGADGADLALRRVFHAENPSPASERIVLRFAPSSFNQSRAPICGK